MTKNAKLNEDFRKTFVDLEKLIQKRKNKPDAHFENLISIDEALSHDETLWRMYKDFRNILSHENIDEYFHITDFGLNEFKHSVEKVSKPKIADEFYIKDITTAKVEYLLCDVLRVMEENDYSNIPIVDDENKVIGMFNSYTLLKYLNGNCTEIPKDYSKITLQEFRKYYSLTRNKNIKYMFITPKDNIYKINKLFKDSYNSETRLELCLVTDTGNKYGELLGIITAYDILKHVSDM